ncbi:MAG: histidine triad nucleotide-binding protein [Candidatus Eremiobacteraeota bacterium]|nr:histidine triad nucleotide-binding protein [Candidatus Eremiobacteraeota bacterium]
MNQDCIFCRIAGGQIPAKELYRDEDVLAIEDVNPQAPCHALVLPLQHHDNIATLVEAGDGATTGKLFEVASRLGRERGGENGFRLVVNTGSNGGQTVNHLHVHVLAGRPMTWPPG